MIPQSSQQSAFEHVLYRFAPTRFDVVKDNVGECCSKVIMSVGISNVIMSGCGDDNPDDERR